MKNNIHIILCVALGAFLFFWSCEDTTSVDNPIPGQVKLVDKSPEDEAVETGIDAEYIFSNGIIIHWHPVQDNDLVGYRVYRSTIDSLAGFGLIANVRSQTAGRIDTSYFDNNVADGTRYYYRIAAEDEDQEGPRSKAANYRLEDVCILHYPPPFSSTFEFEWEWPSSQQPDSFIFRLLKQTAFGTYDPLLITKGSDYSPTPVWSLSQFGMDSLMAGQYRWRIDIIGSESNNGSESDWSGFGVQ